MNDDYYKRLLEDRDAFAVEQSKEIKQLRARVAELEKLVPFTGDLGFTMIPVRAIWLLDNRPKGFIDWGCKKCGPESELADGSFTCYYHAAEAALNSAPQQEQEGEGRE